MTRADPYRSFRFVVEIDSTIQGGFQSVQGLERESRTEPYREGGVNDFEHPFVVLTSYPALVLKRGLVDAALWDWHQEVIEGRVERKTIAVVLKKDQGDEAFRWTFAEAFPVKWSGGELDALSSAVMTETVEFVHVGLMKQ